MVKKKRPNTPLGDDSASNSVSGSAVPSPVTVTHDATEEGKEDKKPPVFKHPNFQHSSKSSNKKRAWRSLKQIIAQERMLPWGDDYIHYGNIDAPPSFKPSKKYSDISGLLKKTPGDLLHQTVVTSQVPGRDVDGNCHTAGPKMVQISGL
ncbi:INO80 complex subunit C isoform X2 [Schistocerca nitens]|uniref:INO80 complex subunit C isoform X2 n=1 Tax=Schistocerca nitens TaxID=7011 RepID=UPI002117C02E|nr:INO80 complex subunit C isoform X2 [Schistocerca nitens]